MVEDLYLHYFDDDVNFDVQSTFPTSFSSSSYPMNFDPIQVSGGFPSPPGSGYSSPVPAYVDSMNDLQASVVSYDVDVDVDTKPDLDCQVSSPYAVSLKHRADLYSGAASSTPGKKT